MEPYISEKINVRYDREVFSLFGIRMLVFRDNDLFCRFDDEYREVYKRKYQNHVHDLWGIFHAIDIILLRIDINIERRNSYDKLFYESLKTDLTRQQQDKMDEFDSIDELVLEISTFFV